MMGRDSNTISHMSAKLEIYLLDIQKASMEKRQIYFAFIGENKE